MAVKTGGARGVALQADAGNALLAILTKGDESLGNEFRDGTRWRDLGMLIGDPLVIGEGLAFVAGDTVAARIGAGQFQLGAEHAAFGRVGQSRKCRIHVTGFRRCRALAIGLGGRRIRRRVLRAGRGRSKSHHGRQRG